MKDPLILGLNNKLKLKLFKVLNIDINIIYIWYINAASGFNENVSFK